MQDGERRGAEPLGWWREPQEAEEAAWVLGMENQQACFPAVPPRSQDGMGKGCAFLVGVGEFCGWEGAGPPGSPDAKVILARPWEVGKAALLLTLSHRLSETWSHRWRGIGRAVYPKRQLTGGSPQLAHICAGQARQLRGWQGAGAN